MRLFALGFVLLACSMFAQTTQPADAKAPAGQSASNSPAAQIDPGKEADIRRLFEAGGTATIVTDMMTNMEKNIRPMMTNAFPPGEYREKLIDLFFAKFHTKADPKQVLDLAIPVYDKYFSDEEIKGLIAFYSTPLGKKAAKTLPQVMAECQAKGQQWGEQLGRQSMMEVLTEHPELEKAMEDARKSAQPQ